MSSSLWGEIPLDSLLKTPKAILEAQAQELTLQTQGLLEGVVDVEATRNRFNQNVVVKLYIKAPNLNNYLYDVLSFSYPMVEFYPCMVIDAQEGHNEANDEAELLIRLQDVLQSDRVKRAVRGLLSQVSS